MRYIKIIGYVLAITLFISCGEKPIFAKKISIDKTWNYENKLNYTFEIDQIDLVYDLVLSLTFGVNFGYQNLYVKIETQYPSGKKDEDILSLNLTNGTGLFLGDCNSTKCTVDLLLQEKFKFNEEGKYVISISQNGREDNLEDIHAVELKLFNVKH